MGTHTPDSSHQSKVLHSPRAYDVLVWVLTLGRERRFRQHVLDVARLARDESVLDVGSGTGSLAIAAKAKVGPDGHVCGIDPSPEMVSWARRKAAKAGTGVQFETGTVEALPFPDAGFDVVLGTLMLHHLTEEGRGQGAQEIARVLKPGGRFLAVDIKAGTGRHRGLLHRAGNHGDFDLDGVMPVFEAAGLTVADRGPLGGPRVIGLPDLRFALARQAATSGA
jgi:ubiquinone/menaquinone biosynthesis C-methylase UbiE